MTCLVANRFQSVITEANGHVLLRAASRSAGSAEYTSTDDLPSCRQLQEFINSLTGCRRRLADSLVSGEVSSLGCLRRLGFFVAFAKYQKDPFAAAAPWPVRWRCGSWWMASSGVRREPPYMIRSPRGNLQGMEGCRGVVEQNRGAFLACRNLPAHVSAFSGIRVPDVGRRCRASWPLWLDRRRIRIAVGKARANRPDT